MENKGFFSIDFIFTLSFILIIGILFLNLADNNIKSSINLEENVESRIVLNKIANSINEVNSNGEGFSKIIETPNNISGKNYLIIISSKDISLEINNKKGINFLLPFKLVDTNGIEILERKIYSGNNYIIEKVSNDKINIREF